MRISERSLPMTKPDFCGLEFRALGEKISSFLAQTAGKILLAADKRAFPAIAFAARSPRTVCAVGEDALPLFSMPEAAGVIAAGGEDVLRAARLYAAVKGIPCLIFPADCELRGAFERTGAKVKGEMCPHPLAEASVCIDRSLIAPSMAEGYAGLLLSRLALFERRALMRFDGGTPPSEEAFSVLMDMEEPNFQEIVLKHAALRRMGMEDGEGKILASCCGNFAAFSALFALYVAFFRCGSPRKFVVSDYEKRARAAGIPFAALRIPTEEDYTRRALVLGGRRAEFLRELSVIEQKNATYCRYYRSLGGTAARAPKEELKTLPERSNGLSAVIRDFGLMDKL